MLIYLYELFISPDNYEISLILILFLGNCTGEISTWKLDQNIEKSDGVESVLTLNSKIPVHNDCVNGVRLVITDYMNIYILNCLK